jgi:pyruvate kinase
MKSTKIIATIGPSCETEEAVRQLIENGVNIFRFNLKHNTIEWHREKINLVNQVAKKLGVTIGTLVDLQGPEIRLRIFKEVIELDKNQEFVLVKKTQLKDKEFTFSHPEVVDALEDQAKILVDDGKFEFLVKQKNGCKYLVSQSEGILKDSKSVTIPHLHVDLPLFTDKDLQAIDLARKVEVDYFALSFVRSEKDILNFRTLLQGKKIEARIIAKIETALAINNLEKIIQASDGIMVARGDLGVEMPLIKVGFLQKEIIRQTKLEKKPVIVATQMLESMTENPSPTRAEINDITNAFYDGTDATMLSGETASGKYPDRAVSYMAKTLSFIEKNIDQDFKYHWIIENNNLNQEIAVIDSAFSLWRKLTKIVNFEKIAFLVFTQSGKTAEILSSFRPKSPIIAIVPEEKRARYLALNFAVHPFYDKEVKSGRVSHQTIEEKIKFLLKNKILQKGLTLIVLHGDIWGKVGGISTIRVVKM